MGFRIINWYKPQGKPWTLNSGASSGELNHTFLSAAFVGRRSTSATEGRSGTRRRIKFIDLATPAAQLNIQMMVNIIVFDSIACYNKNFMYF